MELIKREDALREIQHSFDLGAFRWQDGQDLMDRINALPTIDAVPVRHGEWEVISVAKTGFSKRVRGGQGHDRLVYERSERMTYGIDSMGTVIIIMDSMRKLERENPKRRREDVAVIMTKPLYERLNLEILGYRYPPHGTKSKIGDADIRIMDGDHEEWYITAAHGYPAPVVFDGGKTVKVPAIKLQEDA